ncbi:MAG: MarR family transcriptional regulator [Spirochaetes bacterium]|nr:MarR family transcriptional regulator [Spirochaetota bacterium]
MKNIEKNEIKNINLNNIFEKIEQIYKMFIICKKRIIKNLNITPVETKVLDLINSNINCNQMSIAKALKINKSRVTRIVSELLEKKLIERTPSQDDRRVYCLKLTYYGQEILQKNKQLCSTLFENSILSNQSSEEYLQDFYNCLTKFLEKLEEFEKELSLKSKKLYF